MITNPPNGTEFLKTDRDQTINGTSVNNVIVHLNVTEINADGTAGETRNYDYKNNAGNADLPVWSIDVELYDGDNRITAWVAKGDVRSETDEIIVHVVDEMLEAPTITFPENFARFADTDKTQTVTGTTDTDTTVTLTIQQIDSEGSKIDERVYENIARNADGTWDQPTELFDGTNVLFATSHQGGRTSPQSDHIHVTVVQAACSTGIDAQLDFGILTVGDTSKDGTLSFENTGTQASRHKVHGTDWVNPKQTTQVVMDVGQTKHHTAENTAYAAKRTLTGTMADAVTGLAAGATEDLYLQVRVELDRPSFAGDIQQKITVSSSCD